MNQDPYRPYRAQDPPPPSELERLAAEGQRQHDALAYDASGRVGREARRHLAVAIGGHYGTAFKQGTAIVHYTCLATLVVSIVLIATGTLPETIVGPIIGLSGLASFVLIFVRAFVPPVASSAQCAAEEQWVAQLPFRMGGYLEVLSTTPGGFMTISVQVSWARPGTQPDPNTLLGVVRVSDPAAEDLQVGSEHATWRSSLIDGTTGIRVNGRPVYRNHRIVRYVHELVERTLLPLHRHSPIAHVGLARRG
jgi:hypothetical protein